MLQLCDRPARFLVARPIGDDDLARRDRRTHVTQTMLDLADERAGLGQPNPASVHAQAPYGRVGIASLEVGRHPGAKAQSRVAWLGGPAHRENARRWGVIRGPRAVPVDCLEQRRARIEPHQDRGRLGRRWRRQNRDDSRPEKHVSKLYWLHGAARPHGDRSGASSTQSKRPAVAPSNRSWRASLSPISGSIRFRSLTLSPIWKASSTSRSRSTRCPPRGPWRTSSRRSPVSSMGRRPDEWPIAHPARSARRRGTLGPGVHFPLQRRRAAPFVR